MQCFKRPLLSHLVRVQRQPALFGSILTIVVAMMARPVAGVRSKSLIITLPGSPKGAKENLDAILKLLPHACLQAAGANSRALHAGGVKKLEKEAGVSSKSQQSGTFA
jgi:gephyrin